jgi:hypothetical protein
MIQLAARGPKTIFRIKPQINKSLNMTLQHSSMPVPSLDCRPR